MIMDVKVRLLVALVALVSSLNTFAQDIIVLDSIVVKGAESDYSRDTSVMLYDSLGRYVGESTSNVRYVYNANGKISEIVDSYQGEDGQAKYYNKFFEYDANGNVVLTYTVTNRHYMNTSRTECTYDSDNRALSRTYYEYFHKDGKLANCYRYDYEYKKGVLVSRTESIPIGTRFWDGDKIVEKEPQWKVVSNDVCDKNGNVVKHYDYENGDTLRYQYDADNRMTTREVYDDGCVRSRTEYTYDRHGNVVGADFFVSEGKGRALHHDLTTVINYNLNYLAKDAPLVKDKVSRKFLSDDAIDYQSKMTNLPIRITVYSYDDEESHDVIFYYDR